MAARSVTRFVFAGLIGAATGVVLAVVTVVSAYASEATPWGLLLYGAPYAAGIGAIAGAVVWILTRQAVRVGDRLGSRRSGAIIAAVVAAAGCATLGYFALEAGAAVTIRTAAALATVAASGSLVESSVRNREGSSAS
ncbi:hypothetical protein E1I21_13755 [Microbacterium oleivorans]|uniref:hypothetical protein n=1 Tax=Microbacterium oleivorans TaxID=273677 RepID=UPI0010A3C7B7|nr:hypothetical protein [Microbacterium oleivorans]THE06092.1 hypothetical protein E1I21_13755 [Microbacterium oleivorans]